MVASGVIQKPTGPSPRWIDDLRITYVQGAKKVGTASYDRYQQYCGAQTVAEALKLGSRRSDLMWDWERGILQVVGPIPETAERRGAATKSQQLAATPQKQAPKEQKQAAPKEQQQQKQQKEEKEQQP